MCLKGHGVAFGYNMHAVRFDSQFFLNVLFPQHKLLTNNSINICFSSSFFTLSSLKVLVEQRWYAQAKKEWSSPRMNLSTQGVT